MILLCVYFSIFYKMDMEEHHSGALISMLIDTVIPRLNQNVVFQEKTIIKFIYIKN